MNVSMPIGIERKTRVCELAERDDRLSIAVRPFRGISSAESSIHDPRNNVTNPTTPTVMIRLECDPAPWEKPRRLSLDGSQDRRRAVSENQSQTQMLRFQSFSIVKQENADYLQRARRRRSGLVRGVR